MTSMITARVDSAKRKTAEKIFSEVGLTTSGAINLFICSVAMTGGIPFPVTTVRKPAPEKKKSQQTQTSPRGAAGGIKIGLADNRFRFGKDFDSAFDAMDSEVAELFG